jgi:hypothetical protein
LGDLIVGGLKRPHIVAPKRRLVCISTAVQGLHEALVVLHLIGDHIHSRDDNAVLLKYYIMSDQVGRRRE